MWNAIMRVGENAFSLSTYLISAVQGLIRISSLVLLPYSLPQVCIYLLVDCLQLLKKMRSLLVTSGIDLEAVLKTGRLFLSLSYLCHNPS